MNSVAKYIMTPEQRSYLRALVAKQRRLSNQTHAAGQTKEELDDMVAIARSMGISNTRIAKALNLTSARVSQINSTKKKESHVIAAANDQ